MPATTARGSFSAGTPSIGSRNTLLLLTAHLLSGIFSGGIWNCMMKTLS